MIYPNRYFNLAQWSGDPDDSPLGRTQYQYGMATRAQAVIVFPAAAAFSAVAPFDFLRIYDGVANWTFTFRPDVALGTTTVVGRSIDIGILGGTAAQVAQEFNNAVGLVSVIFAMGDPFARMLTVSQRHTTPNTQVTLTQVLAGITGTLDVTGITAVAGFGAFGFLPPRGSALAGKTKASGWIRAVAGASLVDTETFFIVAPSVTVPGNTESRIFEFDSGGVVTPGNVLVPFTGADTVLTVTNNIIARINSTAAPPNGTGPEFGITASLVTLFGVPFVFLQADVPGSIGGSLFSAQLMGETVANAAFAVVGMSGGQDGTIQVPLRWGLSRAAVPNAFGFDTEGGEG